MTLERSVCVYFVPKYRIILLVTDTHLESHFNHTIQAVATAEDVAMSGVFFMSTY